MIYTVTFRPAIDYVVKVESLICGSLNRASSEEIYYGGKGINVSTVLARLGVENIALGFIAGFTGDAIEYGLREFGVRTDFVKLKEGLSRINVKILSEEETAVDGQGPKICDEDLEQLFQKTDQLKDKDILVLAGSIPNVLSQDIYEKILLRLQGRQIDVIVDATCDLLVNSLKYKPFLIKPNHHELGEIFKEELRSEEEIIYYANKLKDMGARNVLISRGGDGAILLSEDGKIRKIGSIAGDAVNTVGAGDSMVAGFLAGYIENKDYDYALKLGSAAGTGTAYSLGLAEKDAIYHVLQRMQSELINSM